MRIPRCKNPYTVMETKKKVLISGMGVAGVICAILLDKEKYEVELIERADTFRNIGFSIILWKAGFEHLTRLLAVNKEFIKPEKDYFRVRKFILFGGNILRVLRIFDSDGYGWAFERAYLMHILERVLFKQVRKEQIAFSKTIRTIQHTDIGVTVTFNDGAEKPYDIIIIAEGIHSTSRKLVPVGERITPTPFLLRYAWFATETILRDYAAIFFSRGHLGVIHPPYFKNLFGFYFNKGLSIESQRAFERMALQRIKQPNGASATLDATTNDTFELQEVHIDTYAFKRIVFVGDAAHGRPPTLGFGTSLAIEDAALVCKKLNELDDGSSAQIYAALASFSKNQIERVESVYRFQNLIHRLCITQDPVRVFFLSWAIQLFLWRWVEGKIKKLASYEFNY